jgi:hypothetical protein
MSHLAVQRIMLAVKQLRRSSRDRMAPERKRRRLIRFEYVNPVTTQHDLQILYTIGYTTRWDTTATPA